MHSAPLDEYITAERTQDTALIKGVITQLWDTVAEDGMSLEDWSVNFASECWLDIEGMAVFCLHPANATTLIMHAHVRKSYRPRYSSLIGDAVWNWVLEECPAQYQKFTCAIPVIYPNVKKYVESMGMVDEGVNRLSYTKNGKIVDQWNMGITRTEVEGFMNE